MVFAETIGLIASCVQLAELATKSIKHLHSLQHKFREAESTLQLLASQLVAIKSAVKHISLWLDQSSLESIWSSELRNDLRRSLEACGTALQKLSEHSFRLDNDSGTSLLLERMKYVWKADELREYQDLLRDHVQALSFLLQIAQLPSRSQQDTVLKRRTSRRIIEKARDDSSSLQWLRDDQSIGTPVEAVQDNLQRLSVAFDFDADVLSSRAYQATLASFMKQKLQDNVTDVARSSLDSTDAGSVTLRDVLSEIDQELDAIGTAGEVRWTDSPFRANFEPLHPHRSSVDSNLIDLDPIEELVVPDPGTTDVQNDLAGLSIGDEATLHKEPEDATGTLPDDSAPERHDSKTDKITASENRSLRDEGIEHSSGSNRESSGKKSNQQDWIQTRQHGKIREHHSMEALRKVQSNPQVTSFGGVHRSHARRTKRRAHSDTDQELTEQAVRSVNSSARDNPVDDLLAVFEDNARGIKPDISKLEELSIRLEVKPSFLRKMTPFNLRIPLDRGYISGRWASHGGQQSESEVFNTQARRLGYPTVEAKEFENFQRAWNAVDTSRSRYISTESLPKLMSLLEGSFRVSIYEDEFRVSEISRHLSRPIASSTLSSVELVETLTSELRDLPVLRIRVRRKRLNFFYQEALFCADPTLGLNFSEVLKILTQYEDVHCFGDWRVMNDAEIRRSIKNEDAMLLERFIKRRARLQRVEELASVEMLRGMMETFYWRRRFQRHVAARKKNEDSHKKQSAISDELWIN